MNSNRTFALRLTCSLFYAGSLILGLLFFGLGFTGNRPGTDWQFQFLFDAILLLFLALLGNMVCDIAEKTK